MSEPPDPAAALAALAHFISRHRALLVLTGAGISIASGIPGYRDHAGVRRASAPVQGPEFRQHEAQRQRYWARSMLGYPLLARARPNPAHLALAELQARGRLAHLITQNVDGLHQSAGSTGVLELHGSIHAVRCLACQARFARSAIQAQLLSANPHMHGLTGTSLPDGDAHLEPDALTQFQTPLCSHCGGTLQPDVVFFGDGIGPDCTAQAAQRLADADALLVIGSSLMVFSGYRFCRNAAASGKPVAALNLGKTRADDLLALKVEGAAELILPALLGQLN